MDCRLLNGKPRATLIHRFDGSVLLLGPKGEATEFKSEVPLHEIQAKAEEFGWAIGVTHLHKVRETIALQVLFPG